MLLSFEYEKREVEGRKLFAPGQPTNAKDFETVYFIERVETAIQNAVDR